MYYEERPPLVTVATTGSKYHTTVNYSIEESGEGFEVESATVVTDAPIDESCYGLLVSAIVRARYSADQVEAIVCNYNVTRRTTECKEEMYALTDWRTMAKQKASEAIAYVAGGGE